MNGNFENINPWAEKLQQATIPNIAESWHAMQALLDAEMPVTKNKDWRRWLLLIILLLLIIGVCNCPGIVRNNNLPEKNGLPLKVSRGSNKVIAKTGSDISASQTGDSIRTKSGSKKLSGDSFKITNGIKPSENKIDGEKKMDASEKSEPQSLNKRGLPSANADPNSKDIKKYRSKEISGTDSSSFNSAKKINSTHRNRKKKYSTATGNRIATASIIAKEQKNKNQKESQTSAMPEQGLIILNNDSLPVKTKAAIISTDSVNRKEKADTLTKKKKAVSKQKKDSVGKQAIKADSVEDAKGLLLAVGLNQFFPVGNQEKSNFNSSGTSGGIGDYIPVAVVRYYFHKWLYIQAEAQFNTPQYTRTLLASQTNTTDTSKSVFVKKLFYFNLPLSVHYSPFKNLFIGAGLQYSMLTNGVALFQNAKPGAQSQVVLRPNDTLLISAKVASFKNDPVYHELKTYEFRFLFDMNYQWKSFTLGFRYNQAFTNFINVHVSNTTITQAHNASLQLYLRYTIWDHRKKLLFPK